MMSEISPAIFPESQQSPLLKGNQRSWLCSLEGQFSKTNNCPPNYVQRAVPIPRYHLCSPQPHSCGLTEFLLNSLTMTGEPVPAYCAKDDFPFRFSGLLSECIQLISFLRLSPPGSSLLASTSLLFPGLRISSFIMARKLS